MDDLALARWRTWTMRLWGRSYARPADVVDGMLAVQAENHPQASWAVAARTGGTTATAFATLFDAGEVLRTHVLRPTWHYARPTDLRWLLELTAPRVRRSSAAMQRELGISGADLARARDLLASELAGGRALTRPQVAAALRTADLPHEGPGLGLVLTDAELAALICSGPVVDGEHTYAALDDRAPDPRRLDRDEALAELALRYVAGHGPVTERDLAYWASLTVTDARAGLRAVADHLDSFEHDGRTFWVAEPPPPADLPLEPRAHLLQILDEYHNGVQDSRGVLDVAGVVPRRRPRTVGMVLVDTQMVGGFRRTLADRTVTFELDLHRPLAADERDALDEAAARYGAFLGREARLVG